MNLTSRIWKALSQTTGFWSRARTRSRPGFNLVKSTKRQDEFAYSQGQWSFDGHATGSPIADYLLGDANTFSQVSTVRRMYIHAHIYAGYIQDRWKVTRKLTLNYGVRSQFMPLPSPQPGFLDMFLPSAYDPSKTPIVNSNGTITITPNYNPLNGLIRDGVNGIPQNYSTNHQWYWMPMAGFAYDILGDGTTALRGGYGINYERVFTGTDCTFYCGSNYPDVQSLTLTHPSFPNPIGTGTQAPAGAVICRRKAPIYKRLRYRPIVSTWIGNFGVPGWPR